MGYKVRRLARIAPFPAPRRAATGRSVHDAGGGHSHRCNEQHSRMLMLHQHHPHLMALMHRLGDLWTDQL